MSLGMVLEGGAMRGMYTVGVIDVFLENNIFVKDTVGVSAGALFGVNYISEQKGRAIEYSLLRSKDPNYMGVLPFIREGNVIATKYSYENILKHWHPFDDETFKKSEKNMYAVITNVRTGEPEYRKINSVFAQVNTLRASGSMPGVSTTVKVGNDEYLDGGISDSIPFRWMLSQGHDKVLVVLTRDIEYRKSKTNPIMLQMMSKYPAIKERMAHRHEEYNEAVEELKKLEADGTAMVIRPSEPINISKLEKDPKKLKAVYDLGVKDAKEFIEKNKDILKEYNAIR